jgi:tripartite-type tricarboxylate transporter receptor subunit TctC
MGGKVDMMFDGLGSSAAHIKGGRIKALMVSGNKRNAAFPDVPCAGRVGPARLHRDHLVRHLGAQGHAGRRPGPHRRRGAQGATSDELKAIWASKGADFPNLSQQQFGSFVSAEVKRWSAVVKASGAKLD